MNGFFLQGSFGDAPPGVTLIPAELPATPLTLDASGTQPDVSTEQGIPVVAATAAVVDVGLFTTVAGAGEIEKSVPALVM